MPGDLDESAAERNRMSRAIHYHGTPSQRLLRPSKRLLQRTGLLQPSAPRRTLIVAGVQRSGTELVMDMLDTHWHTDVYHEWDARAFDNYQMLPLAEVRKQVARSPSRRIVIKALLEADQVRTLLDAFAPSSALWMLRSYADAVNSMLRSFPGTGLRLLQQFREGSEIGKWRWRGMGERAAEVLRAHDRPDLTDADGHALFWWYRNNLFFDQRMHEDSRIVVLRYEDLARDPETQCRRICTLAGLRETARMRRMPHAGSIGRHTPPSLAPDIQSLCDDIWMRLGAIADAHGIGWSASKSQ